jgi:hypothetical protein
MCRAQDRGKTYHFLPKGRRDAGEESGPDVEREGYEAVHCLHLDSTTDLLTYYYLGYYNYLLPLLIV